jgi:hypothetical protein
MKYYIFFFIFEIFFLNKFFFLKDFSVPTYKQMLSFCETAKKTIEEEKKAVICHCFAGKIFFIFLNFFIF